MVQNGDYVAASPAYPLKEACLRWRNVGGQRFFVAGFDWDHLICPVHENAQKFVAVFEYEDAALARYQALAKPEDDSQV